MAPRRRVELRPSGPHLWRKVAKAEYPKFRPVRPLPMSLTADEQELARIFNQAVGRLQASAGGVEQLQAILGGDYESVLDGLDWEGWDVVLQRAQAELGRRFEAAAHAQIVELGPGAQAVIGIRPLLAERRASMVGEQILGITERTRDVVRTTVEWVIRQGYAADRASTIIGNTVGLAPAQAQALARYQDGLISRGLDEGRIRLGVAAQRDVYLAQRGETIARYEVQSAVNAGRLDAWRLAQLNGALGAGATKVWVANDGACPACSDLDGEEVGLAESFSSGDDMPPAHANCFVAGTLVSGPIQVGAQARWFAGEGVEVVTTTGTLVGTEDHPVLTPQGWVALGLLRQGDEVIGEPVADRRMAGVDPGDDIEPSVIEDAARPFLHGTGRVLRGVPVAAVDLDGEWTHREVDVVDVDRLFDHDAAPPSDEPGFEEQSGGAGSDPGSLLRQRASTLLLDRHDPTPDRGVRRLGVGSALLWAASRLLKTIRLGDASSLDADPVEPAVDRYRGDAVSAAELRGRLSGHVSTLQVLSIRRVPLRCHVYNLETVEGWYVANGILVHNCRCTANVANQDAPAEEQGGE